MITSVASTWNGKRSKVINCLEQSQVFMTTGQPMQTT